MQLSTPTQQLFSGIHCLFEFSINIVQIQEQSYTGAIYTVQRVIVIHTLYLLSQVTVSFQMTFLVSQPLSTFYLCMKFSAMNLYLKIYSSLQMFSLN